MINLKDEKGNRIIGEFKNEKSSIIFLGKNNSLTVGNNVVLKNSKIHFHCNNSHIHIGDNSIIMTNFGLGFDCDLSIGRNVTFTGSGIILLAEATSISIGDDCLIAKGVTIRTDDSHPIYSTLTNQRVNHSKSIVIENKVWLGEEACIMKGVSIKSGSVVGTRSVVTKSVPNNCCVAGNPAKIVNKNIAWVNKFLRSPTWDANVSGEKFYDPLYWNETDSDDDIINR